MKTERLKVALSGVTKIGAMLIFIILGLTIGRTITIDWSVKETVRAKLRVMVKRILRRYGYPPVLQDAAVQTVLQQAEILSERWAA